MVPTRVVHQPTPSRPVNAGQYNDRIVAVLGYHVDPTGAVFKVMPERVAAYPTMTDWLVTRTLQPGEAVRVVAQTVVGLQHLHQVRK